MVIASPKQTIHIAKDCAEDATTVLLHAIEKLESGEAKTISFEEGEYHFYPDFARERFCFFSNHGDFLTRIAFDLTNLEGVTIEGNGSKFIFHNRIIPFNISDSKDINLQNFSVDFAERFGTECEVVANNTESNSFDIKVPETEQYEIRNGVLFFLKADYEHTIGQSILYDPATGMVAYNTEKYTPINCISKLDRTPKFEYKYRIDSNDTFKKFRGKESTIKIEELGNNIIRITGNKKDLPPVGTILSTKGEQGLNRLAPAIKVDNTANFTAQGVTLHHASGMGFLCENSENLTLNKCAVTPAEGYMVSVTADASHFVGCRGKITIKDCIFENQLDDATNIHGAYQEIIRKVDDYTIGVRMGHFQQQNFSISKIGDSIGFIRISDSYSPYSTNTVKKIKRVNGRYHEITFNEPLPTSIKLGDMAENISAYPEVEVTGSTFKGNRARGLLISTPKGTVIKNNTFSTEMEAILMPVENSHWFESGNARNVVISNNHFRDSNFSGLDRGVICFRTDESNPNPAFSNIVISNNEFDHFDSRILEATNVDGLTFKNNIIKYSGTFEPLFPDRAVVTLNHCTKVKLSGNKYNGNASKMVEMLDGSEVVKGF